LPVNGAAQTLTIYGTNFYSATVAKLLGVATTLATTPDKESSTFLTAVIPASLLTAPTTLRVLVSNPAPGGDSVATVNVMVANAAAIGAVVNAASYAPGSVSAPDIGMVSRGELVTIFGTNLGPPSPAPMSITAGGFVDTTSTSGVSVTVDSRPAPLIYVSENQISIQIPYEAVVGPSNVVSVTNGFNPPVTATVTVAATAPGLFTADGSGTGQAAALNYNAVTKLYTLNSSTNLAKIGDTVILYLTGEGVFDSAPLLGGGSDTGFVIPPGLASTPQVNPLPTVMIGGIDASAGVAYAGPIVSSIIGPPVRVDRNLYGLPGLHIGQLGLFKIRRNPDVLAIQGNNRHELLARRNVLPRLPTSLTYHSTDGSHDSCVLQIELRLLQGGLCLFCLRVGSLSTRLLQ
jgi:uncharacterized protein (TIGR03437 family)